MWSGGGAKEHQEGAPTHLGWPRWGEMGAVSFFSAPQSDFPPHSLTVLSKPSVINIKKKMMAKNVDAGMLAMASAYVMKRRLGPETEGKRGGAHSVFKAVVLGAKCPHSPPWPECMERVEISKAVSSSKTFENFKGTT